MDMCFICDGDLEDGSLLVTVKQRGIESFREASLKRKDGKVLFLKGKTCIRVHDNCRKQYTIEKLIKAFTRSRSSGASSQQLRSFEHKFDFKKQCCLCGLKVTEQYVEAQKRLPPSKRNIVYQVRQIGMRKKLLELSRERNDHYGRSIIRRIEPCTDLIAAKAQYHIKCMKQLYHRRTTQKNKTRGRPSDKVDRAMQTIFTFLEQNDEECQFSLNELLKLIDVDNCPDVRTVKNRLAEQYGDDIFISSIASRPTTVCFKNTGSKLLNDAWYSQQHESKKEERLRIVDMAAAIICDDIRAMVYDISKYPPPDRFLEEDEDPIPETLNRFLNSVIVKKKRGNPEKWNKICTALAHCIISAVRPNSFVSNLQVGLAAFLYKKFGSRKLIDVLSSLGFCASYTEAVRFEMSVVMKPSLQVKEKALSQFVFDNADFNTQTVDGKNTFHVMGGIHCISPRSAITPDEKISRVLKMPSAQIVGSFGTFQLQHFEKQNNEEGLRAVKILNLENLHPKLDAIISPSTTDLLWLYGKSEDVPGIPGWNGFMEQATSGLSYEKSSITCLPFINAPPSEYDTIYTALLTAAQKCALLGQETCMVTFDQPLYWKARYIVSNCKADPRLSKVKVRMGGFHLLMSFLGCVGFIMDGSGLKDLFCVVYASLSVEKIMTGHAYARAIRAHILAHTELIKIVLHLMNLDPNLKAEVKEILEDCDKSRILSAHEKHYVKLLENNLSHQLQLLKQRGPTAKLWIQYIEMVNLVKQFIESERMSNWHLHLDTIGRMLPFFHAAGHFAYAKSSHLYLQDMGDLKKTMSFEEYEDFTTRGGFSIRRSDKFWCGTWTDMTIEQSLMKCMKSMGGLTHGRGISDSVLTRWTIGMTSLQHVCEEIENLCGVAFHSSEQHVELRDSRIVRDNKDRAKISEWLQQHFPFPETSELISISTGIVGDERINCHMAREVGVSGVNRVVGGNFETVKFKRKDRVQPLALMSTAIKIDKESIPINPTTLFHRISIAKRSDEELEQYLSYDLGPYSLTLFDHGTMRKGTKASLYKAFMPAQELPSGGNIIHVIDGGYLLHRVVWQDGQSFASICQSYLQYVKRKYGSKCIVVFDGYPENEAGRGTKSAERLRRSFKYSSVEILFDESMVPTMTKEKLLANPKNKSRFISMLMVILAADGMVCKQAKEDADTLVINTALSLVNTYDVIVVVGEDVDLLVILISLCKYANIYFLKPGRGKIVQQIFSPLRATESLVADHILFLHSISGCDTTSALFNQGKIKFIQTLKKTPALSSTIKIFYNPEANQQMIADAGEKFLISLYNTGSKKEVNSLDQLRYKLYLKMATKFNANLAALPPASGAAREHSLRVYHQVQQWLGNEKPPQEWGWRMSNIGFEPITTRQPPAPDSLLQMISCRCKKVCKGRCSCKKAGLNCSPICINCEGKCENMEVISDFEGDDLEADPFIQVLEEDGEQPEGGLKEETYRRDDDPEIEDPEDHYLQSPQPTQPAKSYREERSDLPGSSGITTRTKRHKYF